MSKSNAKIRFGIVGTGKISGWFISAARRDSRFEARTLVSRDAERGHEYASRWGIPQTCISVSELCADKDIDAVYIATPNSTHHDIAIEAMKAGKHVLCEKPMASNAAEVRDMVRTAEENGVLLMEAMIATVNPNFLIIKENIARVGVLRRYFASYCQYSSRYDALKEGIVANAFRPEYSNGALMDIGVYTIYPMVALFGKPDSIHADALMLPTGVDGQGTATFVYKGMNATVQYSKIADSYLPFEIEGENGCFIADSMHIMRHLEFVPRPAASSGRGPAPVHEDIGVQLEPEEEYTREVTEFISCIQEGRTESGLNKHDYSIWTAEIMDEIRHLTGLVYPADR